MKELPIKTIVAGDSFTCGIIKVRYSFKDGTVVDKSLAGCAVLFQLRERNGSNDLVHSANENEGLIVRGNEIEILPFYAPPAGSYYYQLQIEEENGFRQTVIAGTLTTTMDVAYV